LKLIYGSLPFFPAVIWTWTWNPHYPRLFSYASSTARVYNQQWVDCLSYFPHQSPLWGDQTGRFASILNCLFQIIYFSLLDLWGSRIFYSCCIFS